MKRLLCCLILAFACLLPGCREGASTVPSVQVHFSPKGGCTDTVVDQLGAAKKTVLVQAYSFTSAPIAKALVEAQRRGVEVQVILDRSQETEKYSSADFLLHAGVPVRIDAQHAIAHNKIMILDGQVVITGSFNFTKQAEEHNAENLLVIRDPSLAGQYTDNWHAHAEHSQPYSGKEPEGPSSGQEQERPDRRRGARASDNGNPASGAYVASANSALFHKAGCKSAAKISAKNRGVYATRDEAIQAGKQPCQECNP